MCGLPNTIRLAFETGFDGLKSMLGTFQPINRPAGEASPLP